MPIRLNVHLTPATFGPFAAVAPELTGRVAVVIDVLRATTTIVHALAQGAKAVVPCLEINDAVSIQQRFDSNALLGGERGGVPIAGFQLGNSPTEYSAERVAGRTILFTTTNGTRALQACRSARRVLIAAFVNRGAVCRALTGETAVEIVCAGTDGKITREDTLLAGAIACEFRHCNSHQQMELNDEAEIAFDAWQAVAGEGATPTTLLPVLRASLGGRNLIAIGHEKDIETAAQIDRFDFVPELDMQEWRITKPNS